MHFYKQEPVYKQNFFFTLRERLKCEDKDILLVILVTSRPTNVKARQAIRQSWGSQNFWWGNQVLTLFLLGHAKEKDVNLSLSIIEESIFYGDIIQQDFLDTYFNLTLKTIMAFKWVTEFCSNARYVMKTDSDVFINTGNLVKYLVNSDTTANFITGYPLIEARCYRNIHAKAYVSHEEYPFEIFPPYLSGLGYVLDTRLARRIYVMMAHVKPIKFEDVYVGICLSLLHVGISVPTDTELFLFHKISFDFCKFRHLIAVHALSPDELVAFWDVITRGSFLSCD
ncbi:UDP-GalNAc:beta-1,3-N-acetylgalactosaminyltransferase 1-like [Tiliqua scincoides]|uniref:UDP-GalNAc:beta-1, 3-N-acetylgalactosaminyltransferase 1-like n=1 Tax=Tiliqua scincoides TaxID=71010 RepID=UPI003462C1F3